MKRLFTYAAAAMTPIVALSPSYAQDGAFSMGQLTGTLSQDHNTQRERARSLSRHGGSRSEAAQTCANARSMIRRGNSSPKLRQLRELCARSGY